MKKIINLCIAIYILISNQHMFGMLLKYCRPGTKVVSNTRKYNNQMTKFDYEDTLKKLEFEKFHLDQQLKNVNKEITLIKNVMSSIHFSEIEKTTAFRSTDQRPEGM